MSLEVIAYAIAALMILMIGLTLYGIHRDEGLARSPRTRQRERNAKRRKKARQQARKSRRA